VTTVRSPFVDLGSLAQEQTRAFPVRTEVAFGHITEALLDMGCRITASDSGNGILSFEQAKDLSYVLHRGTAVRIGTLHVTPDGAGVKVRLFLAGHFIYPDFRLNRPYPCLPPAAHREFLDQLAAFLRRQA